MRLLELDPILHPNPENPEKRHLEFLCPKCPRGETRFTGCVIMLPIVNGPQVVGRWGWNGEEDFEKMTITPSIFHHCESEAHFFITRGEIVFA